MKKKSKIILAILLVTVFVSSVVFATDVTSELDIAPKTSVNLEDTVGTTDDKSTDLDLGNDDLIMPISDSYKIDEGNLDRGDLFILQTNATINEKVDGNLFVVGDNIDITADVDGNVFAIAERVKVSSNISGSLFVLAEDFDFANGSVKDAYFCATTINIDENVYISREAKMLSENINILGMIFGDVYTAAENITLGETGSISGKLVYSGELKQSFEGQVGSLEKKEREAIEVKEELSFTDKLENILTNAITALLIIGLIVLASNKKPEVKVTPGDVIKGIIKGALWVIVIPVVAVLLILTILGLPFALILLLLYILMFFVAIPAASLQVSAYILNVKNKDSKVLLWLLGTVVYIVIAILELIPVLDVAIPILVGAYGFNLIIKTLFPRKKKEVVAVVEEKAE